TSEKIRLEKFSVILHPGKSQPEEYISHLLVERHNGQIKRHDLKVNHPVMIGFTKLFQMRYRVEILRVDLRAYRNKTLIEHLSLKPGESKTLSEETFSIRIDDVIPDFTMNKEGKVASRSPYFQNPAVLVTVFGIDPSGERKVWAFQDLVPHEKDKEEWSFSVEKIKKRYISGIKLSRDPGVPLAYSGFILLIFGAFVASFVIPRELILSFSPALDGKETRMEIQGYKTKDTFGLQRELKSLSARVANILTGKDS
ncbi:MAG: cytochrome c biogenesis protein ResB, partial [Candidatus Omnitrophica bacterium]|nr:cytochrome c biogenesis protein ResB [Candidatus Omnitrophota bacterium]